MSIKAAGGLHNAKKKTQKQVDTGYGGGREYLEDERGIGVRRIGNDVYCQV
jgi:hypothetical protein